ncbi:MAG TPA: hypothetical protein PL182_02685 [Pseudobdellovibrionaceae bacterium]|nr:hypothetical protein [Pseudobdellovibrionaceae bacterium]
MKARMLCFLIATSLSVPLIVEGKEKTDFNVSIEASGQESAALNTRVVENIRENETVSFYNADWLSLRKRKKRALASVEVPVKLKRSVRTD